MQKKPLLLVALALALAVTALVRRAQISTPYARATLLTLLEQPVDRAPGAPDGPRPPFWKTLLAPPFTEPGDTGPVLRLGRVLADPSAARGSADSAGELLALEAGGPQGKLGIPLWRAILTGPSTELDPGVGRTLKMYGCRHSADADAAPVIEDSYAARLALAAALRAHAAEEDAVEPLTLVGELTPARGGVNFDVQLVGNTQAVSVTFDGHRDVRYSAARTHRPEAPNDERARARLVELLHLLAAQEPALGALRLEGGSTPATNGVDLRLEFAGGCLSLVARRGAARCATHYQLSQSDGPELEGPAHELVEPEEALPSKGLPNESGPDGSAPNHSAPKPE